MDIDSQHTLTEGRAPCSVMDRTAREPGGHGSAGLNARGEGEEPPFYSDDLLPGLQQAFSLLANIEVRYEIERDYLESWPGPRAMKDRLATELDERHAANRERLQACLAGLRRRAAASTRLAPDGGNSR